MPTALRKLLWSLLTFALVLGGIEGFARWAEVLAPQATIPDPGEQDLAYQDDLRRRRLALDDLPLVEEDTRGWALQPGALLCYAGRQPVRVNSLGFRGPDLADPEPGELRLMPLGDSSCFGFGMVEAETLGAVAAQRLSASLGRPVRETNACVPGYDSAQALQALRRLQPHVLPAWVIVTAMWSDLYRERPGLLPRDVLATGRAGLGHLAGYRLIRELLSPFLRPRKVRWILDAGDIARGSEGQDARIDLRTYAVNLAQITEQAANLGARTLFLALPAPVDFDLVAPPETISLYRQAMAQVASEAGAPIVDGPAFFRAHGADETFFLDQVHPDARGHALLGQAVAEAIAAEPAPPPQAHHFGPADLVPAPAPAPLRANTENMGGCDVVREAGVIPK